MEECHKDCHDHSRLSEDVKQLKENVIEIFSRLNDSEKESVGIKKDLSYIKDKLDDLVIKVERLIDKPAERWNDIIKALIVAVISAGVGIAIMKIKG